MSPSIHLDKEITDQTAQKLRLTAESLFEHANRIYAVLANAEWEGSAREEFLSQLYRKTASLKTLSDSLDLLGFQLSQETETWISISARFSHRV